MNAKEIDKLINTLHPLERKVLPHLSKSGRFEELVDESKLTEVEVMRALQWMENKGIIRIKTETKDVVRLDRNGNEYVKKGLPEMRFLKALSEKAQSAQDVIKKAGISQEELGICLGTLKSKAAIEMPKEGVLITEQGKKLLQRPSLEEEFLKRVSKSTVDLSTLKPEEKFAYDNLKKRKEIIKAASLKQRTAELTDIGKELLPNLSRLAQAEDSLTQEILKTGAWKKKTFRRYDVKINVPRIYGGKRHFVNQAIEYGRRIWLDLGFKEMEGPLLNTSFWNFDALFTAQDHPVRDLQDTYYIKDPEKGNLPEKELVEKVRKAHENGYTTGSKGWQYKWNPENAKLNVMRTHTTVLSARTLAALKEEELPAKFFSFGKCFRNETIDWSHLFEFNQTEGIVVAKDINFRHLLGYLKEFFRKMGFPKARFRPAYFPYTEPSVEIDVFHPTHKKWIELGGAGMFRPELIEPLLGKGIQVLAWGPGFDRIIMDYYKIMDMRDLYKNDIKQLREMKAWMK